MPVFSSAMESQRMTCCLTVGAGGRGRARALNWGQITWPRWPLGGEVLGAPGVELLATTAELQCLLDAAEEIVLMGKSRRWLVTIGGGAAAFRGRRAGRFAEPAMDQAKELAG